MHKDDAGYTPVGDVSTATKSLKSDCIASEIDTVVQRKAGNIGFVSGNDILPKASTIQPRQTDFWRGSSGYNR